MTDQLPPHSLEVELGIIGCFLTDAAVALAAIESSGVHASQFYDLRHSRAFNECVAMHADGKTVTVITVLPRLKNSSQANATDWLALLNGAADECISAHACGTLCDELVDLHRRRVALDLARRIAEAARSNDCGDVLTDAQNALDALSRGFNADSLPSIVDAGEFVGVALPEPRELVRGVLHQGAKLVLGGSSKSF